MNVRLPGTSRSGMVTDNLAAMQDFSITFDHYWDGRNSFWGDPNNVVQFHSSRPSECHLVMERLRQRDSSKCDNPSCQDCIAHADHVRLSRPRRPVRPRLLSAPLPIRPPLGESISGMAWQAATYPTDQSATSTSVSPQPLLTPSLRRCLLAYSAAAHGYMTDDLANVDINHQEVELGLNGSTLLHCAAYGTHPETVDALLNQGADPNLRDSLGNTALHRALQSFCPLPDGSEYDPDTLQDYLDRQARVVRSLLTHMGGNALSVENSYGLKPIEYLIALDQSDGRLIDYGILAESPGREVKGEIAEKVFEKHKIPPVWSLDSNRLHEYGEAGSDRQLLFDQCRYPRWEELDRIIENPNDASQPHSDQSSLRPEGRLSTGANPAEPDGGNYWGRGVS